MKIIAEVGINYAYGPDREKFVDNAKRLIKIAALAGCDYTKFQKRDPEICVPDSQKKKSKRVPWREKETTYLQYKEDIEFNENDYKELFRFAEDEGIELFASVWDIPSAEFMNKFTSTVKIPSACITQFGLLNYCRGHFETRIMSTGMSTEYEVDEAVKIFDPTVIMHTNSVYPTPVKDLNLGYIHWLQDKYSHDKYPEIGLSSHYYGITDVIYAMGQGVTWLEKHITLNHNLWGSDQAASVEPHGLFEMMKKISDMARADDGYCPRSIYPGEEDKRKSLRRS